MGTSNLEKAAIEYCHRNATTRSEYLAFIAGYNHRQSEIDELYGALKELVHLHMSEQEGIQSAMPTAKEWFDCVVKAGEVIEKYKNE